MRIPHDPPDETFPINVTNMIDVFLLLLIFFLVATTFVRQERDAKIQLPGTAAVRPLSAPPRDLVINIRQDGTVTLAGETVNAGALATALRTAAATDPDRNILIRADERSLMKSFAAIARQAREAGFSQLRIGYIIETPKQ